MSVRWRSLFVLTFLVSLGAFAPGATRDRYVLRYGGQDHSFDVATDELEVRDAQRHTRKLAVAGAANGAAVRQAAERHTATSGEEADLVLYETGAAHREATRRILTKQIAVKLKAGADPAAVAAKLGLVAHGEHPAAKGWFLFDAPSSAGALDAIEALATEAGVETAEPQLARHMTKRSIPNDPLFGGQWHLRNTGQSGITPGIDVNVTSVWDTWKGTGIRLAIVDDGLQVAHPDLSPNVDTVNDHDWNDTTPTDPSPDVTVDYHGTSCAGVAGARGNNSLGVSGAAPEVTLVGFRLIAAAETDSDDADAMGRSKDIIQIKSNSWGPDDSGSVLEAPGTLMQAALADAVSTGRGGLGTIFVWAGGNGGDLGDNSNYDGYANSLYTIGVGALDSSGHQAYYSEPGANLIVCAPSSGGSGTLGITTTDLTGTNGYNDGSLLADTNYTNDFGGTSSAAPLTAGVIALLLQSKPTLGWRDVQEILLRSATKVDATDSDWVTNSAGFHFNHKYGAGLLNAQAAVNLAATWTNLPAQQTKSSAQNNLAVSIPDNNATGITRTFTITGSPLRVERATLKLSVTHANRGELEVTLTSPRGTVSRLAEKHGDMNANYSAWTFSTVHSWGELSTGNWTLKIADRTAGTTGTLTSATLTLYGTPGNNPPTVTAATVSPAGPVFFDQSLTVGGVTASDVEGDPFTLSYQWEQSADNVTFNAIGGATGATLALTSAQSGKYVHCAVSATDASNTGLPFATNAVAVNRRPVEFARSAVSYSYDCDLLGGGAFVASRSLIINEFTQGPSGSKEWVELLTLQTSDLRGYSLRDNGGLYGTFASVAAWSAVPAGTLIVLYNSGDKDPLLPADDLDPSDHLMVVPINNTALITSGVWPGLANSGQENIQIRDAANTTVDGICFGGGTATQTPALTSVGTAKAATYTSNTEAGVETAANWSIIAATAATPGAANNATNAGFLSILQSGSGFRLGASSDVVPGLSLDAITGVLSGTPNVPAGGLFHIVIERAGSATVSQSFSLLVADANGNYVVPAGKTWTLDQPSSVPGNLSILGSIDTAGLALTVNGTISVGGSATVTNATGSIAYLQRTGSALPGTTLLIPDAANDLADLDGDGTVSLLEFELGMDPSIDSRVGLPQISTVAGHLTLTYSTPAGAGGVTATVEVSSDLIHWNTGAGFTEVMSDTTASGLRTLIIRDVATGAPQYIRLKVSRP